MLTCPHCRTQLEQPTAEEPLCPHCGRNVAWLSRTTGYVFHRQDLWRIAKGQRFASRIGLVIAALYAFLYFADGPITQTWITPAITVCVFFFSHVLFAAAMWEFGEGFGWSDATCVLVALLTLTPGVNLLLLLVFELLAWRAFRRVGLPWRFFGRSEAALAEFLASGRCRKCGYNLTGNTSGICPECGTPVEM